MLISRNETYIVFDFGRGVANAIAALGLKQDDVQYIILSHFHPDHLSDLIPYLHAASWSRIDPRSKDLNIYGPVGLKDQMDRLFKLFTPQEIDRSTFKIFIHELSEETLIINGNCYEFISLPPANNHGLRFAVQDKIYAITGDAESFAETSNFLKDVDVAIVDAGHITEDTLVRLAIASQAKQILCSHLYREINASELLTLARQEGYQGVLSVAEPFQRIAFFRINGGET